MLVVLYSIILQGIDAGEAYSTAVDEFLCDPKRFSLSQSPFMTTDGTKDTAAYNNEVINNSNDGVMETCRTPVDATHKNRTSLLASLENKGKKSQSAMKRKIDDDSCNATATATAAAERLSLSCDLISTLTDAEMDVIDCYASKLASLSGGEVDENEAYALAMVTPSRATFTGLYPALSYSIFLEFARCE